jgi:hypothetical protein
MEGLRSLPRLQRAAMVLPIEKLLKKGESY